MSVNQVQEYCMQHGLEYLYNDGTNYVKTSDGNYLEVKINEKGDFIIPTNKGDMVVSKKHYNADCLDAFLRQVSAENNIETVRYYIDAKGRSVNVIFNEAELNPAERMTAVVKKENITKDLLHFANAEKFNEFSQKNSLKALEIFKVGDEEYKYKKTDNGYTLYTPTGEITLSDNGNNFLVTQNGITTTHEKHYDYSFKVGEEEIIATKESLDLGKVKEIRESEIADYNRHHRSSGDRPLSPKLVMTYDDPPLKYDNENIYMNIKYFATDNHGDLVYNSYTKEPELSKEGKIKFAGMKQLWRNNYNEGISNPEGISQEEALRLNIYNNLSAVIAEVREIHQQFPYPEKAKAQKAQGWFITTEAWREANKRIREEVKKYNKAAPEVQRENCEEALKKLSLPDSTKYQLYVMLTTKNHQNPNEFNRELAKVTYDGYMQMYCGGLIKENDIDKYSVAVDNIRSNVNQFSYHTELHPVTAIGERFSPSSNDEEYMRRVNRMFSSVNGIYMADIVGKKDTHFNVDQLYNEALRSYANLDVEYTMISENTLKAKMRDDRSSYAQATENLEHIAENQNNNEKSANVNTDNIMALMATKNGNSL